MQDMSTQLYSNPHSGHLAWRGDASASEADAHARALTLAMCNASELDYECIFVSGATGTICLHWLSELRLIFYYFACKAQRGHERVPLLVVKATVSSAAGAMKLVADSFPWSAHSRYIYTQDNHNSAVGVREVALNGGASAVAVNFIPGIHQGGPAVC